MKKSQLLLSWGLIVVLTGCAQPLPSIHNVDTNNLNDEQAILVVTAGADETCTSFSSVFVVKEATNNTTLVDSIGIFQLNNSFVDSDFDDEYGKVYTTVLKPGEYDFWLYAQNPFFTIKGDPTLTHPFTLRAGEIKYVGEVHSDGCQSMTLTIRNKNIRDLTLLKSVKPGLNIDMVKVEPARLLSDKGQPASWEQQSEK